MGGGEGEGEWVCLFLASGKCKVKKKITTTASNRVGVRARKGP